MTSYAATRRYLTPVIAVALIAALAASLIYFRKYSPYKVPDRLMGNPEIVLSLSDVEIVGRSDGEKLWSFKARRADVSRGRINTQFIAIGDGKLYDEGKIVATVTAGRAIYNSSSGNVAVAGGVKVAATQGYRAEAEEALWSAYFKQLRCPGGVIFATDGSELSGQNLVADFKKQEVTLEKAKMTIDIADVKELEEQGSQAGKGGVK
jgi:hypothetical protein